MHIGEAATATGMTTKTLRFYEGRGLLPAPRRAGNGYREYGSDAIARLDFIRRSRIAGLTLTQIGEILRVRDAGQAPCTHVRDLLARQLADLDQQVSELLALRSDVAALHNVVAAADPVSCDPGQICSFL
ncbi:MAG: heavy metal-responsive transcriptional regulator [Lacisediminihabitans sp.]